MRTKRQTWFSVHFLTQPCMTFLKLLRWIHILFQGVENASCRQEWCLSLCHHLHRDLMPAIAWVFDVSILEHKRVYFKACKFTGGFTHPAFYFSLGISGCNGRGGMVCFLCKYDSSFSFLEALSLWRPKSVSCMGEMLWWQYLLNFLGISIYAQWE